MSESWLQADPVRGLQAMDVFAFVGVRKAVFEALAVGLATVAMAHGWGNHLLEEE